MYRLKTKIFSITIASVLILPNLLLISLAQNPKTSGVQEAVESIKKADAASAANEIVGLSCPPGASVYYELNDSWWQKIDRAVLGYTLGDSSKPTTCIVGAQSVIRDSSGKVTSATCSTGASPYYDQSGEFKGCLVPPTKITRAGDGRTGTTISIKPYKSIIPIPCQNISGISNVNCAESYNTPGAYVLRIYQFALLLVGMAAFGQIVFGGLEYILAAGSFAKIDSAKKRIWDALSGLLLLLGAYFVLFNINPDLVSLRDPMLKTVDTRELGKAAEQNLVDSVNSFTGGSNSGSGDSSGGTLCKRTVNFGVTVNTNIKFEGIQFMKDDDTVTQLAQPRELPQIPQSGCFECQPNSSKDSSGTCQCNSGYTQEGNQCLLPKIQ